jgi:Rrf2 family protein
MRLTRASRYAIGALVHLARRPSGPLASHDIARAEHIPEWFLLKVLKPIAAAGILYSYRGPGGGYQLARPTKSISLLEVIETVEGPIRGHVEPWDSADSGLHRRLQEIFDRAATEVRRQLKSVSIAELAKGR